MFLGTFQENFREFPCSITGRVTDRRRYCRERGGMEIPCKLTFSGKQKHIQNLGGSLMLISFHALNVFMH